MFAKGQSLSKSKEFYLSDDVRKQNRLRIISQFRASGKKSRTEIGKLTDLSPGTVTNVTTTLLDDDIINIETPDAKQELATHHGRPRVQLVLNSEYKYVVAGSLTFNRISLSVHDYAGTKIFDVNNRIDLAEMSGQQIAELILQMLQELPVGMIPAMFVIGVQGLTANNGTEILWSPILSENGRGFASDLKQMSGVDVIVANDCAMIARSVSMGRQDNAQTFATVLMSYGIGLGLYIDGQPFKGAKSSASELGHIPYRREGGALCRCGKTGCVEAYASDYAIWRNAYGYDEGQIPNIEITSSDIAKIIELASQSDGPERRAIIQAGRAIGYGLATMFGLFDPFPVVFVGRGAQALEIMEEEIRAALSENFRFQKQLDIEFSKQNDALGHVENGCAIIGLEYLDQLAAFGVVKPN